MRTREEAMAGSRAGHDLFARIRALPCPTVAAINGACLGGGLEVALHCDARTISKAVRHFAAPECFLGIIPAWGGTQLVPRLARRREGGALQRPQPDAPEQDALRPRGVRVGLRRPPARCRRVPGRVDRVRAGARRAGRHAARGGRSLGRGRGGGEGPDAAGRLRARRRTRSLPRAGADRGRGHLDRRGGLPRRGGGSRGSPALAGGARLALRVRPRRAAREAEAGHLRRCGAAPRAQGRHRRRGADGVPTGSTLSTPSGGAGGAPRRAPRGGRDRARLDPRRDRREPDATTRARRAFSAGWSAARPATRASPIATS